jgi:hypothetical protein
MKDIWECPTCGLKGDYGIEKEEDNFCPLCDFPNAVPQDKVGIFRAIATIFEDKDVELDGWWYTALWDNVLQNTVMYTSKSTVKMLFEHKVYP